MNGRHSHTLLIKEHDRVKKENHALKARIDDCKNRNIELGNSLLSLRNELSRITHYGFANSKDLIERVEKLEVKID